MTETQIKENRGRDQMQFKETANRTVYTETHIKTKNGDKGMKK